MNHLKRPHHTMSEDEDDFSDREICSVSGSSDQIVVGGTTRKRRRGVIEKRRRDRINNSLNELKRLVPTALEKSGSAKLEKAEILQMTVDHLKVLQGKGFAGGDYDSHRIAMDYHNIGFRECAAEVARYLATVEGLDIQDPLRVRLMSHLQMFANSRSPPAAAHVPHTHSTVVTPMNQNMTWMSYTPPAAPHTVNAYDKCPSDPPYDPITGYFPAPPITQTRTAAISEAPSSTSPSSVSSSSTHYTMMTSQSSYSNATPFTFPSTTSLGTNHHHYLPSGGIGVGNISNSKPYRPWGAEMAC